MADGLCLEPEYADLNFQSNKPRMISRCVEVCGRCIVRDPCRRFADAIEDTVSVLGGEDPAARKARWRVRGRLKGGET